jgi:putative redox protein
MTTITPPMAVEPKRSATVEARWQDGYRTDITVRQFRFVADEPSESGGLDAGPMPTEYLLVAMSSCFATALGHVARKRDIVLGPVAIKAVATYDGPSFSAIELRVEFEDGPPAAIDDLIERASRVCYVSNTLARRPNVTVAVSSR